MAVDFEAIRKKLGQLSGNNRRKNSFWRPDTDTDYTVRILPFSDNDGQPFKERHFYYNIGKNRGLLAPYQFDKPDPFQELITKLRDEGAAGSKESYELAKKLYPKMRAYAAVIVRGEESEGPRLWSFGKTVYQQLLNIMIDEDYGDITDPLSGRDIKIKVTKPEGQQWAKTEVLPRGKQTKLSGDAEQVEKWVEEIPSLDDIYQLKSYDVLAKIINDWLSDDEDSEDDTGTERSGKTDASDSSDDDDDSSESTGEAHANIDDAFKTLMKD